LLLMDSVHSQFSSRVRRNLIQTNRMYKLISLAVFLAAAGFVEPHGYLKEPIARTSIQLRPEFGTSQPYWWDNQGVWCNNVQQDVAISNCGRCGETAGNRDASQNGMYDKKVIAANFTAGSIVAITANFQAPHNGYFDIELCPQDTETDSCFQRLTIVSGTESISNNRICVPYDNVNKDITARVQLPAGVRCNRCTIRWNYRTAYQGHFSPYDPCFNPNPAQTFRNCADVRIA